MTTSQKLTLTVLIAALVVYAFAVFLFMQARFEHTAAQRLHDRSFKNVEDAQALVVQAQAVCGIISPHGSTNSN